MIGYPKMFKQNLKRFNTDPQKQSSLALNRQNTTYLGKYILKKRDCELRGGGGRVWEPKAREKISRKQVTKNFESFEF